MTGLENISPGRNLQLIPYAAFSRSHFLDQPDPGVPAFRGKTDFRPGLDAKAVIHDTLTLDVALNPDFSQVESDDPQVTVNQRFEVVFPEKRPFFLENNGYFSTPENLFFSRRIVDPEFGGRITGKLGHWNLGVLAIDDRAPGSGIDPADPNYCERAAIGVAACSVTSANRMRAYCSPIASSRAATIASPRSMRDSNSTTHGHSPARRWPARRANSTVRAAAARHTTSTCFTGTENGSTMRIT
jgi:hypothetical protein